MTHSSDTELREQLQGAVNEILRRHDHMPDVHNLDVDLLEALISAKLTEARIDELKTLSQSDVMFFNNSYEQAKLISDRIKTLQSQETQL